MKRKTLPIIVAVVLLLIGSSVAVWFWARPSLQKVSLPFKNHGGVVEEDEEDEDYFSKFSLEEGSYYRLVYNNDTCFVRIESLAGSHITGTFFPLEEGSDCVSPHTFTLNTRWFSCILTIDGEQKLSFVLSGRELENNMDGRHHQVTEKNGQEFLFAVTPYSPPVFTAVTDRRFSEEVFRVETVRDVEYGENRGYWTSLLVGEDESYGKIVREGLKKSIKRRQLPLTLDLYVPLGENHDPKDTLRVKDYGRPVVIFLHGGAMYVGDKAEPHIAGWCRHFASLGYVAVSVNYRMGFLPMRKEIQRTGLEAMEDVQEACRYIKRHAAEYDVDTNLFFVAGTSAGSILALQAAFQPQSDVRFVAAANMWGAVTDLSCLENSRTDIVSFHGDADPLVPYEQGYPFSDINGKVGKTLFGKMYGSLAIHQYARKIGRRSKFYSFPGAGHALHLNPDRSINQANYRFIQDSIAAFFYDELVPLPVKVEQSREDARHFFVDNPTVRQVMWQAKGAFVLRQTDTDVWLVWPETTVQRIVEASGHYANGIGFTTRVEL